MSAESKKKSFGLGLAVAALVLLGLFGWFARRASAPAEKTSAPVKPQPAAAQPAKKGTPAPKAAEATDRKAPSAAANAAEAEADAEPETAEDREEKLVNAFDDLTDVWQDPAAEKVTMDEIARFREQFNRVPAGRKDECIHRALNLIPDENVMLLAGILLDKTQEKDILETVYGDILNRDEDVKRPILQEIFKDKTHPCWADTAWILDVTDDLPNKNKTKEK